MADTGMQAEVVRARLTALEYLVDDIGRQFSPLQTVQARQGSAMWTDIVGCAQFANQYTSVLANLEYGLMELRIEVQKLFNNLLLTVNDLVNTEEDIRDRMIAIAEKLNAMPGTAVPPPATPTAGGGSPAGYGPTMSGGYGATMPGGSETAYA